MGVKKLVELLDCLNSAETGFPGLSIGSAVPHVLDLSSIIQYLSRNTVELESVNQTICTYFIVNTHTCVSKGLLDFFNKRIFWLYTEVIFIHMMDFRFQLLDGILTRVVGAPDTKLPHLKVCSKIQVRLLSQIHTSRLSLILHRQDF